MRLGTKLLLILAAAFILLGTLLLGLLRLVVTRSFEELERAEAAHDMERCRAAIAREIEHLSVFALDWSAWDDTYRFVQDRNAAYIHANLSPTTFETARLNVIYFFDQAGRKVWGAAYEDPAGDPIHLAEFSQDPQPAGHPLFTHRDEQSQTAGILATERGLLLFASRPVTTTERRGPIMGTLVMGRFLDDKTVRMLADQTRVEFRLVPANENDRADGTETEWRVLDADRLLGLATLMDYRGRPVARIEATIPRDVTQHGDKTLSLASLGLFGVGGVILIVMGVLLHFLVVRPITALQGKVMRVGKTADLSIPVAIDRGDEIGTLSREFQEMMKQLDRARQAVMEQSFRSGMAEMAVGALHNLGNAINPVSVCVGVLCESLDAVKTANMEHALEELAGANGSEERRVKLEEFVRQSLSRFLKGHKQWRAAAAEIAGRLTHAEGILRDLVALGRVEAPAERMRVFPLIEQAVSLLPRDLRDGIAFDLTPGLADLPPVRAERVRLMQVFGNVLINAAESIRMAGGPEKRVVIDGRAATNGETGCVQITIRDTVTGIAPEDLVRIFQFGVTTKSGTHRGLGLHWSANAVAAMNGRIFAESEGPSHGAVIHIQLPVG